MNRLLSALLLFLLVPAGCATSDRPLQLVAGAGAIYPSAAKADGVEGQVKVAYGVTVDGRVVRATVVESEPAGVFDEAALEAVRQWRFNPPVADGKPQSVERLTSVLRFRVGDDRDYDQFER